MEMARTNTKNLILTAMMTAVTAVSAIISVPLPFSPVPVSLATLAVLICGGLLGPKYGAIAQAVYLLLGCVGAPVFHNFTSGLGIVMGPTGGFLAGYILMAFTFGLLLNKFGRRLSILYALIATLACYIPGLIWFMIVTGSGLTAAISMAVLPFIPVDILKCIIASWLVGRLWTLRIGKA